MIDNGVLHRLLQHNDEDDDDDDDANNTTITTTTTIIIINTLNNTSGSHPLPIAGCFHQLSSHDVHSAPIGRCFLVTPWTRPAPETQHLFIASYLTPRFVFSPHLIAKLHTQLTLLVKKRAWGFRTIASLGVLGMA